MLAAGCTYPGDPGTVGTATPAPTPTASPTATATATPTPEAVEGTNGSRPVDDGDTLTLDYSWKYLDDASTYTLSIPSSTYEYYGGRPRIGDPERWGAYVTDPYDDEVIEALAGKIESDATATGLSRAETADYAIVFVQSMRYVPDNVSTPFDEYPKYPVETLVERGGDCEDTSILMAALLQEMGYDTVLILLPGHVGIGIRGDDLTGTYYEMDGERYYYIETTGEGWRVGELPEEYRGETATLLPPRPEPVLVHSWRAEDTGTGQVEVSVDAENLGSAPAEEFQVEVALDAPPEDRIWSRERSEPETLEIGENASYTAYLDLPRRGAETRVRVRLLVEGLLADESVSNWVTVG